MRLRKQWEEERSGVSLQHLAKALCFSAVTNERQRLMKSWHLEFLTFGKYDWLHAFFSSFSTPSLPAQRLQGVSLQHLAKALCFSAVTNERQRLMKSWHLEFLYIVLYNSNSERYRFPTSDLENSFNFPRDSTKIAPLKPHWLV